MNLIINGELKNNKNLNLSNFLINEESNNIQFENLSFNDSNQIIKIDQANFNYLDSENRKNNYNIKKVEGQNYLIEKKENKISFNTNLNIKNTKFKIDNINYKKKR